MCPFYSTINLLKIIRKGNNQLFIIYLYVFSKNVNNSKKQRDVYAYSSNQYSLHKLYNQLINLTK